MSILTQEVLGQIPTLIAAHFTTKESHEAATNVFYTVTSMAAEIYENSKKQAEGDEDGIRYFNNKAKKMMIQAFESFFKINTSDIVELKSDETTSTEQKAQVFAQKCGLDKLGGAAFIKAYLVLESVNESENNQQKVVEILSLIGLMSPQQAPQPVEQQAPQPVEQQAPQPVVEEKHQPWFIELLSDIADEEIKTILSILNNAFNAQGNWKDNLGELSPIMRDYTISCVQSISSKKPYRK